MVHVLFSVANWGLGHATRDVPLIRECLARGCEVSLASSGAALTFLKQEFPSCTHFHLKDKTMKYSASNSQVAFVFRILYDLPRYALSFEKEHKELEALHKEHAFDLVISDGRYGSYLDAVPSYIISHQLHFSIPHPFEKFEIGAEIFNLYSFDSFEKIIVPDNHPTVGSLAGKLSQPKLKTLKKKLVYAGILCSIDHQPVAEDIDYLLSVSGPEPRRTELERIVLDQVTQLPGKKVVALGKPHKQEQYALDEQTYVYSHLNRQDMESHLNRAACVVTRSGYTTMMELANIRKRRALFIPTPGLTEQEYLASYYEEQHWFHAVKQDELDLAGDVQACTNYSGFPSMPDAQENARKLVDNVLSGTL
ncbi:MAG: glycosyltransferase family protein [archaeon]